MALTQVTEKGIKDGEIVNADVNASAAIAGSKLAASTTSVAGSMSAADKTKLDGIEASATADQTNAEIRSAVEAASDSNVFTDADHTKLNGIAASANNYTHPNHSGDVTSSADGATTIADNAVTLAKMAGGTDGQIITYDASGDPVAVGPGTDGQVLTSTGAGSPPAFEDVPAGGAALTGSTNNTITTVTGANAIQGEANLTWDGSVLRAKNTDNAGDGVIYVEGGEGANAIIEMYADEGDDNADKWLMKSTNGGGFHIQNKATGSWANNIVCATQDSVALYYNGSSKFATTNTGVNVTGGIRVGGNNAANELDDYEIGSWTPTFHGGSNFNASSNNGGEYVKIGKVVHIRGFLSFDNPAFTSGGQSWDLICGGLPFAPDTGSYGGGVVSVRSNSMSATSSCYILGSVSESATTINLKVASATNNPADTNLTASSATNYTSFVISGTYNLTGL